MPKQDLDHSLPSRRPTPGFRCKSLGSNLFLLHQKFGGWGPAVCILTSFPRDSDTSSNLRIWTVLEMLSPSTTSWCVGPLQETGNENSSRHHRAPNNTTGVSHPISFNPHNSHASEVLSFWFYLEETEAEDDKVVCWSSQYPHESERQFVLGFIWFHSLSFFHNPLESSILIVILIG